MSTKPNTVEIDHILSRYLQALVLGGALLCICGVVLAGSKERDESRPKSTVGDLRMYVTDVLRQDVLDGLASNESKNRIIRLGKWVHAPFEVRDVTSDGSIRIRFEDDYLIIWHHRTRALGNEKGDVLQFIREATQAVLAAPYAVGEPGLVVDTKSALTRTDAEIVMFEWPREIPGTGAVSCGYYNGTRKWKMVEIVHVLVKGQDSVIALEKPKARHPEDKHVYEGLNAGKIRLTEEEAEKFRSRPVLAKNAIFAKDVDVSKITDALLNACMWPAEDKAVVGAEDVGPASQLRPQPENRENNQR